MPRVCRELPPDFVRKNARGGMDQKVGGAEAEAEKKARLPSGLGPLGKSLLTSVPNVKREGSIARVPKRTLPFAALDLGLSSELEAFESLGRHTQCGKNPTIDRALDVLEDRVLVDGIVEVADTSLAKLRRLLLGSCSSTRSR